MKGPSGNGNGMVAHYSGTVSFPSSVKFERFTETSRQQTLDAQARYANGTLSILENWTTGKAQTPADVIVANGEYATKAYGQRK